MLNNLAKIKEALFDAPTNVKAAFNQLVNYFAVTDIDIKTVLDELVNAGIITDYKYVESTNSYELFTKDKDYQVFVMNILNSDLFAVYPYPKMQSAETDYYGKLNSAVCKLTGVSDAVKNILKEVK